MHQRNPDMTAASITKEMPKTQTLSPSQLEYEVIYDHNKIQKFYIGEIIKP